ncbi:TPA: hypothetical protein ACG7GH_001329 [Streptococcus agalactiae]
MELTLTTFFGLSEEHAARIMALDETSRNKKIEEYRRLRLRRGRIDFIKDRLEKFVGSSHGRN